MKKSDIHKKLLAKRMTRKEFIQLTGGSMLLLFGAGNLVPLLNHFAKTAKAPDPPKPEGGRKFGTRKFGM